MPWIVLLISGVLEAVWATALGESRGFTQAGPTAVFLVGLALSMLTLAYAARHIPIGTAYAIWVGIGAALTVAYAMITGAESVSAAKIICLVAIVGSVIGLKLVKSPGEAENSEETDPAGGERSSPAASPEAR